eukprot:scaffold25134_cov43-Cyclotella_meneghiniana.AAC.1
MKLSNAALLSLQLLTPSSHHHYNNGNVIALASGFSVSSPILSRGGNANKLNSNSPATSSSSSSSSLDSSTTTTTTAEEINALSVISSDNWEILSERGAEALRRLILFDSNAEGGGVQRHVYGDWPERGVEDEEKREIAEQIADLDSSYPGGLPAYLTKAQTLLRESAEGSNPFAEFEAFVPEGESLSYENPNANPHTGMTFSQAEQVGLTGIGDTVFVLVAGGLGERLGYS